MIMMLDSCPDCGKLKGKTGDHNKHCDKSLVKLRERRDETRKQLAKYIREHPEKKKEMEDRMNNPWKYL